MENSNQIIGRNICNLRENIGIDQHKFAEMINVSMEDLKSYESGRNEVPILLLEKISDFFCFDLSELLNENPEIHKTNIAFAFRASEICSEDFESIAHFGKIIRNYFKMNELIKG